MNTVERHAAGLNRDQIITTVNDILQRPQACIESDGGAFEYKLKSFKKRLIRYFFYCGYILLKCSTLSNINNILITIKLDKQLYYYPFYSGQWRPCMCVCIYIYMYIYSARFIDVFHDINSIAVFGSRDTKFPL